MAGVSLAAFSVAYHKWYSSNGYRFYLSDADKVHRSDRGAVVAFPKNDSTKLRITQSVDSLNAVYDALYVMRGR